MNKPTGFCITFSRVMLVTAVAIGLLSAVAKTARADEWRDHERQAHDWHKKHMHHHDHDRPQIIEEPNIVYAPPVIVEPPPAPADDNASSGFNLIIPINIH